LPKAVAVVRPKQTPAASAVTTPVPATPVATSKPAVVASQKAPAVSAPVTTYETAESGSGWLVNGLIGLNVVLSWGTALLLISNLYGWI
jgi:hypothetical protein